MTGLLTATIEVAAAATTTPVDAHVLLPSTPESVGILRHLIRLPAGDFLRLDDVLLIVSELVTCGIPHPGSAGDVTATVAVGEHAARITASQDAPVRTCIANTGFGRRMALVHGVADLCHPRPCVDVRVVDEGEAAGPQLAAGGPVVGLGVGLGFARPTEEPPGRGCQPRVADETEGGSRAVFEALDVVAELAEHDLGGHVRGRMQTVDGDLGRGQPLGRFEA